MSDWFSFWSNGQSSDTSSLSNTMNSINNAKSIADTLSKMKTSLDVVGNLTNLFNIPVWKKQRDVQIEDIENKVLAGQADIFRELSYNTDQAIVYAARGNVSIGAPVLRERMKKGAEEAGRDFAMLRTNADIQKLKANQDYAQKRRSAVTKAVNSFLSVAQMAWGAYNGGGWGNTGSAYGLESTVGYNGVPMYGGSM